MHPSMEDYLFQLAAKSQSRCPGKYRHYFTHFWNWLTGRKLDPLHATSSDLHDYQQHLSQEHRTPKGARLSPASQVRHLSVLKDYYHYLERCGVVLVDVSKPLQYPRVARYTTKRDYFSLQEVTALLQTQARRVQQTPKEKLKHAIELRTLAFLGLAVATGRRHQGLRDLKVADLDFERNELRVDYEKGRAGRVLPVAGWAMAAVKEYLALARPRFTNAQSSELLFISKKNGRVSHQTDDTLPVLHRRTCEENPDLTELPHKKLTMHGLRVTFAKLLFNGGCNLRSVNELMLHSRLSTTAYYTPLKLEELRATCQLTHPRA